MTRTEILGALDEEIERLRQARQILQDASNAAPTLKGIVDPARPHRVMSEEGRRRIAEAQRRRWAKAKV